MSDARQPEPCDLIIAAGWIICADDSQRQIRDGAVAVRDGLIVDIGDRPAVLRAWSSKRLVDVPEQIMLPGLINPHNHSPLMALRGMSEDLGFAPAYTSGLPQGHRISAEEAYALSRLANYELLKGGCTTVGDWYWQAPAVARAASETGLRMFVSGRIMDVDSEAVGQGRWVHDRAIGDQTVQQTIDVIERWHGKADGRVRCFVGVHAADTSSLDQLKLAGEIAARYDLDLHTHINQNPYAIQYIIDRDGRRPVQLWSDLGLLNERLAAAHCIFSTDEDISALGRARSTIVNAPFGNLYSGAIAPIVALEEAGARIVLATDTCSGDMFDAMRLALSSARVRGAGYATTASTVLRWSLRNAAEMLGMGKEIGALEIGRRADMVVLQKSRPGLTPVIDAVGTVVWRANAGDVQHVIVEGEFVIEDGRPSRFDGDEVVREGQRIAEAMWSGVNFDRSRFVRRELRQSSVDY